VQAGGDALRRIPREDGGGALSPRLCCREPSTKSVRADIPDVWIFIEMRRKRTVYVVMNSEKVRSLREQKGVTKRDLATEAGVSVSTSKRVEREAPVTFRTRRVVAEALGVEPSPSLGRVL